MSVAVGHDLIVVGAGIAGLNAALAASLAGLDVVLIEKSGLAGGATGWSYGALWVPGSAQAAAAGFADSGEETARYLAFLGGGEADTERADALIASAARVLAANEAAGIRFALIEGANDILHGKAPGAAAGGRTLEPVAFPGARLGDLRGRLREPPGDDQWRVMRSTVVQLPGPGAVAAAIAEAATGDQLAQGPAIVAGLLIALKARGVPIMFDTAARALLARDGAVTGVRTDAGALPARAVLLATGNYAANLRLVAALDKLPDYQPYFPDTSDGDGMVLASTVGAAIAHTRNNLMIMLGLDDPAGHALQAGAPSTRELPRAGTIVVNAAGRRFGNEANFQELSRDIRALDWSTRAHRNLPCWMIADHRYVARWGIGGRPPGEAPDFVAVADDIPALAVATGIDGAGLAETIERINRFAAAGIDEDFGRAPGWAMVPGAGDGPNPSLGPIATPPFYAARLRPTVGVVGAGVKADAAGRVLGWDGAAIPGLYCAGDAALHDEFGIGYQAGVTYASAMTFAWLAVEDIAGRRIA